MIQNFSKDLICEKCRGKIVCFTNDVFGNVKCGYCGEIVKYPKLSKKGFEILKKKILSERKV